ncbi:hypothetical protein CLAIMM_14717 [Cladophialophora immunda]|nr:hypothetical protein CLAIMM_14717 [Cladophialophora immunda]
MLLTQESRPLPLTRRNLKKLDKMTASGTHSSSTRTRTTSLGTSSLNHRRQKLEVAGVKIVRGPPPLEIQALLELIWAREVSDERREQVTKIVDKMSGNFELLDHGSREDDWIDPIVLALGELDPDNVFCMAKKSDLSDRLRPAPPPPLRLRRPLPRPSRLPRQCKKPQGIQRKSTKLNASRSLPLPPPTSPPSPPPPPQSSAAPIQTPIPDVLLGFHPRKIVQALVQRNLGKETAERYLEQLNDMRELCFTPTREQAIAVRYPFLVIEGKAYSTGQGLSAAHYQTSRAGCYLVNHQRQLRKALESNCFGPGGSGKSPLVFSIATHGDVLDLWVHYFDHGYKMNRIDVYGWRGFGDLFLKLERIMGWSMDNTLNQVADALVAKFLDRIQEPEEDPEAMLVDE